MPVRETVREMVWNVVRKVAARVVDSRRDVAKVGEPTCDGGHSLVAAVQSLYEQGGTW